MKSFQVLTVVLYQILPVVYVKYINRYKLKLQPGECTEFSKTHRLFPFDAVLRHTHKAYSSRDVLIAAPSVNIESSQADLV